MKKGKILGYWDYTVVLTYLGMVFSFIGIIEVIHGNFLHSMVLLILAGICDMFDGAVASTKDRDVYAKSFGIQIDSLSDIISFGVLPAFFVYMHSGQKLFVGILSCIYLLCGLVRLAYYNVQEAERQKESSLPREVYLGVPITTAAMMLPLLFLIYNALGIDNEYCYIIIMCVMAAGFVSTVEIKKPHLIGKLVMIIISLIEIVGAIFMAGAGI